MTKAQELLLMIKEDSMSKNALRAATLLALLSPSGLSTHQNLSPKDLLSISIPNKVSLFPREMHNIIRIESSNGKNINHQVVKSGMNKGDRAIGFTGLMPITAKETIEQNKKLSNYRYLLTMTNNEMTDYLNKHPEIEAKIVSYHWNRIKHIFDNDSDRMLYAWNKGITGAKYATDGQIANDDYVNKANRTTASVASID